MKRQLKGNEHRPYYSGIKVANFHSIDIEETKELNKKDK